MTATQPSATQLWIKSRCIQVETQFSGTLAPEPFALRFFFALGVALLLHVGAGLLHLPAYAFWLLMLALAYYTLTILAKRFRDIGKTGANLLQLLIPLFVILWMGSKIPPAFQKAFHCVLWFWPVVTIIRLCLQPTASDDAPRP